MKETDSLGHPTTLKELVAHGYRHAETRNTLHADSEQILAKLHDRLNFQKLRRADNPDLEKKIAACISQDKLTVLGLSRILRRITLCHLPIVFIPAREKKPAEVCVYKTGAGMTKMLLSFTSDAIPDTENFGEKYTEDQFEVLFKPLAESQINVNVLKECGLAEKVTTTTALPKIEESVTS